MKISNKKGIQLSNAFGAVLAVVLIAVLVIIAIFLFEVLGTGFPLEAVTVTNETGASITSTAYTVSNASACNFQNFAVTSARNTTDNVLIAVGNYTVDSTAGTIIAVSEEWDPVTLIYTYQQGGDACSASSDMVTQFATYPALVGLVGTIVFLGLVIGVLVASFVFGGKREV